MSSKLSRTIYFFAGLAIVASAWQPIRADDDLMKRRDEARLVLLEEHVEQVATAAKRIADAGGGPITQAVADKRAAADAISAIVTNYFLARRIKPVAAGDQQAQAKVLREVTLLLDMSVQANQCKDGDAEQACEKLTTLIEKFRASITDEGQPAEKPADSPKEKPAEPKKQEDAAKDESEVQISEAERALFNIVNAYRKKQGLEPLQLDEKLCRAAHDHSSDMNQRSFFSHQSPVPGRSRFTDRAGNYNATAAAENIARDCKDAKMAMSLWVNSQHHRENLVGSHTRIGVGVDAKGLYTQVFGK